MLVSWLIYWSGLIYSTCRMRGDLLQCLQTAFWIQFPYIWYFIKKISPICSDNRSVVITTIANLFGDYTVTKYYAENIIGYYSNQEMADMHFMYDRANGNVSAAQRLYAENFLIKGFILFKDIHQCYCESGWFETCHRDSSRSRSASTPNTKNRILRTAKENLRISVRIYSQCSSYLENALWAVTIFISYPTNAITHSTELSSESRIFAVATRKMCIKSAFHYLHFI